MSPSQADDVRVGAVLGGTYEVTSLLGEGGMGYVFAARHLRLPKQVAVKVLKTGFSLSPDIVARFRREAEIASRLGHPNIVEVLDFDTLPSGTPFLVLEFLKGESLGQRLARGPLSWEETREVALQVGAALLAAHRAGVVHRDLKPDNIFLLPGDSAGTARHRVKLLDFGISKLADSGTLKTQDSILMGTPQYMSPEQALGNNSAIDARSDVFALGCIYYEMLAGRPAFSGDNLPTVVYRIVHEPPRPLPEWVPSLPPHAWPALQRALAKSADERTPDVATLTEELTGTRLREQAEATAIRMGSSSPGLEGTHVPASTPLPHRRAQPSSSGGTPALEATFVPGAPRATSGAGAATPQLDATFVPGTPAAQPMAASDGVRVSASAPAADPASPPLDATYIPGTAVPAPAAAPAAPPLEATFVPGAPEELPVSKSSGLGVPASASAPTAPSQGAGQSPGMGGAALAAAVVALALGAGLYFNVPLQRPGAGATPPVVPVAPAPPIPPSVPAAPAPAVREAALPSSERADPSKEKTPAQPSQRPARAPSATQAVLEPRDGKALAEFERAEQALAANNPEEALFRAQRSLGAEPSGRARSVVTRAHCALRDLGNARAQFQNVPGPLRPACKQWCAKFDIDLGSP